MHDGDPKRADRKAKLLAAFFLRTRLATAGAEASATPALAITDRQGKSVRPRPRLRQRSGSMRQPWRRGAPDLRVGSGR
jgi:hypothetical protein